MKHFIDPTIDYVFKRLLATVGNEAVLIDFLNSLISPETPIIKVQVLNPYNDKEYSDDKLSIVDIKVTDGQKHTYQIEVQLTSPQYLTKRILFTWSEMYTRQMKEGDDFNQLKPTISIWLLTKTLFDNDDNYHHQFQLWDKHNNLLFNDHCAIHVFELSKWHKPNELQQEDNWLYFFKEAKHWKRLPKELKQLPVMRQAMDTLKHISDQTLDYYKYCKRQDSIRVHLTDKREKEAAIANAIEAQQKAELAEAKAEQAEAYAEQAEAYAEQAETKAIQAEAYAEQAEAKAKEAEALAEQTELKVAELMDKLRAAGINPK